MAEEIAACPHVVDSRFAFLMRSPDHQPRLECWRCAPRNRRLLRRSILVSLVIGSILTSINQGHLIFDYDFHWDLAWRIPLTYCVPFLTASLGALGNARIPPDAS